MSKIRTNINQAFAALTHMCDSNHERKRLLESALAAAVASEREHRAAVARFTDGCASYSESVQTAARYFVVKWVLEPLPAPRGWLAASTVRDEVRLASALRELLSKDAEQWVYRWTGTLNIDYAKDIAEEQS